MPFDLNLEGLGVDNPLEPLHDEFGEVSSSLVVHHDAEFFDQMVIDGEIQTHHVSRLKAIVFVLERREA